MELKFVRKAAYLERSGFSNTEFHEAQKQGRVSPPDGYLGPRSPIWTEETVQKDLRGILTEPKPVETRPKRRRITKQDKGATHDASPA
jgi:hypothetical protein